jgi:hypothetical protein
MQHHESADHQGNTPPLTRAQRRQAERAARRWATEESIARNLGIIGSNERLVKARPVTKEPNHQVWQVTESFNSYTVTADLDDECSFFGHEVVLMCVDANDNLHSAYRVISKRQLVCVHIRRVIEWIDECECEMCRDWQFFSGDAA